MTSFWAAFAAVSAASTAVASFSRAAATLSSASVFPFVAASSAVAAGALGVRDGFHGLVEQHLSVGQNFVGGQFRVPRRDGLRVRGNLDERRGLAPERAVRIVLAVHLGRILAGQERESHGTVEPGGPNALDGRLELST